MVRGQSGGRRAAFEAAAAIEDTTERLLEAAAVIAEDLAEIGRDPIVVGGLAVAYWAAGTETTSDIDVAMADHAELSDRLEALGLRKEGRAWTTPDHRVIWERPADVLESGWESVVANLRSGRSLSIITLEDAIVDRMHSLDATGDPDSFHRAVTLLGAASLDRVRLEERARQESLAHVLSKLDLAVERIGAGHVFEPYEVHDLFPRVKR
jgi:hypothetical protein